MIPGGITIIRTTPTTYYELLGIRKNATDDEIRNGYYDSVLKFYRTPGHYPDADLYFAKLKIAFEELTDPLRRPLYDNSLDDHKVKSPDEEIVISDSMLKEGYIHDPIEEAVKLYAIKWSHFSSYPAAIKRKKIFAELKFRILYLVIGAIFGLLITIFMNLEFSHSLSKKGLGVQISPQAIQYYREYVFYSALVFFLFGRYVVFAAGKRLFGFLNV